MLWRFLLYTAALSIGIFGAQTQFRFVVFQVEQLLGVERSTTLSDNMTETKRDSLTNDVRTIEGIEKRADFVLTVLWNALHLHTPSHTQLEPGPPTQGLWRQTTKRKTHNHLLVQNQQSYVYVGFDETQTCSKNSWCSFFLKLILVLCVKSKWQYNDWYCNWI